MSKSTEIKETDLKTSDFELSGGFGNYSYYTKFQPAERGYFYIKAYEITSNDRLSEEFLNETSKIEVTDLSLKLFKGNITITREIWTINTVQE